MLLPVVTKRFICYDVHRAVPTVYKTVHGSPYPYSFHLKTCNTTWISIAINFSRIHLTVLAPFSWVVLVERWRTHATFLWIKLQMRTLLWSLCATHIMDYRYFVTPNGNYSTEKFGNFSTSKFIFMVCIADQGLSQTNLSNLSTTWKKFNVRLHALWTMSIEHIFQVKSSGDSLRKGISDDQICLFFQFQWAWWPWYALLHSIHGQYGGMEVAAACHYHHEHVPSAGYPVIQMKCNA